MKKADMMDGILKHVEQMIAALEEKADLALQEKVYDSVLSVVQENITENTVYRASMEMLEEKREALRKAWQERKEKNIVKNGTPAAAGAARKD